MYRSIIVTYFALWSSYFYYIVDLNQKQYLVCVPPIKWIGRRLTKVYIICCSLCACLLSNNADMYTQTKPLMIGKVECTNEGLSLIGCQHTQVNTNNLSTICRRGKRSLRQSQVKFQLTENGRLHVMIISIKLLWSETRFIVTMK